MHSICYKPLIIQSVLAGNSRLVHSVCYNSHSLYSHFWRVTLDLQSLVIQSVLLGNSRLVHSICYKPLVIQSVLAGNSRLVHSVCYNSHSLHSQFWQVTLDSCILSVTTVIPSSGFTRNRTCGGHGWGAAWSGNSTDTLQFLRPSPSSTVPFWSCCCWWQEFATCVRLWPAAFPTVLHAAVENVKVGLLWQKLEQIWSL